MDHVVGMSADDWGKIAASFYRTMIDRGCTRVELQRANPATATEHKSPTGSIIRESLPVRWIITVYHPSPVPGGRVVTTLRAGLLNGRIRLTQPEAKE
jgi:hypothetical protein